MWSWEMSIKWLRPHPEMIMAPAPSGNGMLKIIQKDNKYLLYQQTKEGMELLAEDMSLGILAERALKE
jgi:hypothetical protein